MTKEEFKEIRELLDLSQEKMANLLKVSKSTVKNMEKGTSQIDFLTERYLLELVGQNMANVITMDVSDKDTLSLAEMIDFIFKHKKEFLNTPEMKLLIDNIKSEERANIYENHIILKNESKLS